MNSDVESSYSGFQQYGESYLKNLYLSLAENMTAVKHEIEEVESNLHNIVKYSAQLEEELKLLLQVLPKQRLKPKCTTNDTLMETTLESPKT